MRQGTNELRCESTVYCASHVMTGSTENYTPPGLTPVSHPHATPIHAPARVRLARAKEATRRLLLSWPSQGHKGFTRRALVPQATVESSCEFLTRRFGL